MVRFSISQIGKKISYTDDEEKVKLFLDGLESDPDIQDVLYRTAGEYSSLGITSPYGAAKLINSGKQRSWTRNTTR